MSLRLLLAVLSLGLGAAAGICAGACDRDADATAPGPSASVDAVAAAASASAPARPSSCASTEAVTAAAREPPSERLVIVAGGDVNLARNLGQRLLHGEQVDPFEHLRPVLDSADLRFLNLESQLSDQGGVTQHARNPLVFTGPPQGADLLRRAGIDVVALANNHMWDYGLRALRETLANLDRVGIAHAGATDRWDEGIYEPAVLRYRGWSVALFAVTQIWNQGPYQEHRGRHYVAWARFDILKPKLAKARREHDVVLVSYHGGAEYMDIPMGWTREFVRVVMDAGVDAVIGHHPHVPHGVGWREDRPAFYSLGNLVFPMHQDYPWTGTSFLARLTFTRADAGTRLKVEACPYYILGVTPMLFDGTAKPAREIAFRRHLREVSMTVGGSEVGEPGSYSCMELGPPSKRPRPPRRTPKH